MCFPYVYMHENHDEKHMFYMCFSSVFHMFQIICFHMFKIIRFHNGAKHMFPSEKHMETYIAIFPVYT